MKYFKGLYYLQVCKKKNLKYLNSEILFRFIKAKEKSKTKSVPEHAENIAASNFSKSFTKQQEKEILSH